MEEEEVEAEDEARKQVRETVRSTSKQEYGEDASALKPDDGRGDRRNVQGELHPSDEP